MEVDTTGLNERQRKALEFIKEKGKITNREYREMFNVVKDTAIRDLKELVDKKIVVRKGAGRNVCYTFR